jgi:hypothetical protein
MHYDKIKISPLRAGISSHHLSTDNQSSPYKGRELQSSRADFINQMSSYFFLINILLGQLYGLGSSL